MSSNQFIGKGEVLTGEFLKILFPNYSVIPQFPIRRIFFRDLLGWNILSTEVQKHNFDFLVSNTELKKYYAIEVNYKHKEKAAKKWRNIFVPILLKNGIIPVAINDYDCKRLFKSITKLEHYAEALDDIITAIRIAEKENKKLLTTV